MKPMFYSGFHAIEAILRHRPQDVLELFVLEGRDDKRLEELAALAQKMGVTCQRAARKTLDTKAESTQHQGVVARARARNAGNDNDLDAFLAHTNHAKLLLLDGVTDPHNLGACLRVADGAGINAVIVPKRNSAGLTATACRSAAGAAESLAWFEVNNLARTQDYLKQQGVFIYGTALTDKSASLYAIEPPPSWALVMGAEGPGMRRLVQDSCDQLITIPMRGDVQSLNVSVATGVVLYWLTRP